jgi:branched-chain amino acid transport system permease protein
MAPDQTEEVHDRDILFQRYYDSMQREFLKTVICDEVIREHKAAPFGQHSEPLERLLHYFRNRPLEERYAIKHDRERGRFRVMALTGVRGEPPCPVDDAEYATLEDAYHGIFLRQVDELVRS